MWGFDGGFWGAGRMHNTNLTCAFTPPKNLLLYAELQVWRAEGIFIINLSAKCNTAIKNACFLHTIFTFA